jgi:hypothetical protein
MVVGEGGLMCGFLLFCGMCFIIRKYVGLCVYHSFVVFVYSGCICVICVLCKFGVWFVDSYCLDVFFKACLEISACLACIF